jgi:tetratricopeptide (TPR) repeat protein
MPTSLDSKHLKAPSLVLTALFALFSLFAFPSEANAKEPEATRLAQILPQSAPITADQIRTTPARKLVSLRSAVKSGLVKFQLTGDGVTTSHVRLQLTNTTKNYLRVVIPANEVFRPNSANVQMMMSTMDKIISLSPETTAILDLPTVCASVRSIKPPGKEGTSFEVGAYPDLEAWKDLAGIMAAAKKLDKEGAYQHLLTKREARQSTIAQLAIWMLLGRRTGNANDQITPQSIGTDMLDQVGTTRALLTPEKLARFDKGVDEIFQAADITLKRGKDFRDTASIPGDSAFDTFKQVGQRAFDGGDYVEAEELLNAAVAEAVNFGEMDARYIDSLNKLGSCYLEEGRYTQAESTLKTALDCEQKKSGLDCAEAGTTLTSLGLISLGQKKYDDAKTNLTKALAIKERSLGAESTGVAETLLGIGQLNLAQQQFNDAEAAFRKALAIQYKNAGPQSAQVAECNKNLADVQTVQGNYAQAERLYLKALEIGTSALGADNPFLATILIGLSSAYQSDHKNEEAQKFATQAAAINEKAFGNNKTLVASLPNNDYAAFSRAANFATEQDKIEASVKEIQTQTDPTIQALQKDAEQRLHRQVRDKWALVIGISKFADSSINLKYASKDAKDFCDYLVHDAHFSPDHVRLLLDEKATRENILSQLGDKWLPRAAGPDDLVVIYISSHGSPSQADVAGVNYIVAYNTDKNSLLATGIPLRDLTSMIKERIHSDRIVVIMDACHSGAAVEEQQLASKGLFRVTNFSADEVFQGTGQMVICSSQPSQVSWESKEYPNGVFTRRLLEGLRKSGNNTLLSDAYKYMKDSVQNEVLKDRGELQTPVFKSKWQGNDLQLAVPPTDAQPGFPDDGSTTSIQTNPSPTIKTSDVTKTASKSTINTKAGNSPKRPTLKK